MTWKKVISSEIINIFLLNHIERRQFANVIDTFKSYAQYSLSANNRRRKDIYLLSQADQDLLGSLGYKEKLDAIDKAILANADFLAQMVEDTEIFGDGLDPQTEHDSEQSTSETAYSHTHSSGELYASLVLQ